MSTETSNRERLAIDPAAWQTADCEHCDGHIMRRASTLDAAGPCAINDGRWRHVRNGKVFCYGNTTVHGGPSVGSPATPRLRPESEV